MDRNPSLCSLRSRESHQRLRGGQKSGAHSVSHREDTNSTPWRTFLNTIIGDRDRSTRHSTRVGSEDNFQESLSTCTTGVPGTELRSSGSVASSCQAAAGTCWAVSPALVLNSSNYSFCRTIHNMCQDPSKVSVPWPKYPRPRGLLQKQSDGHLEHVQGCLP